MSKFKKLYRDFFGLNEISSAQAKEVNIELEKTKQLAQDVKNIMTSEETIEEAQLTNNITDYNGHVMYRLRDPQEATAVAKDLQRWTTKKGFTIIKHERSRSGLTGYFYFRLGEDPGSESQKIQGYFSQMPELVKFAFQAPRSKKKPPARRMPPKRKI